MCDFRCMQPNLWLLANTVTKMCICHMQTPQPGGRSLQEHHCHCHCHHYQWHLGKVKPCEGIKWSLVASVGLGMNRAQTSLKCSEVWWMHTVIHLSKALECTILREKIVNYGLWVIMMCHNLSSVTNVPFWWVTLMVGVDHAMLESESMWKICLPPVLLWT